MVTTLVSLILGSVWYLETNFASLVSLDMFVENGWEGKIFWQGFNDNQYLQSKSAQFKINKGQRQTYQIVIPARFIHTLKIKPANKSGKIEIYKISLRTRFSTLIWGLQVFQQVGSLISKGRNMRIKILILTMATCI